MNKLALTILMCLTAAAFCLAAPESDVPELKNLNIQLNPELKAIRADIQAALEAIKGRKSPEKVPPLRIFKYRLKKNDDFWKVMSSTALDMDTLITLNGLSALSDIKQNDILYISNMRGILFRNKSASELEKLLKAKNIEAKYVEAVNGSISKEYLFVPCGEISKLERSLFLGTGFINPLTNGKQSSGFGVRKNPWNGKCMQFHSGIDLACPTGSRVMAARNGTVVFTGPKDGYGRLVVIAHEHGYSSLYGHLSKYMVKQGQKVIRGQVIALSGNTGKSTGPHLHFEVRRGNKSINPGILRKIGK